MATSFSLLAQEVKVPVREYIVKQDSVRADSLIPGYRKISSSAIDQKVTYSAAGQVKRDIHNKRVILIDKAVVR